MINQKPANPPPKKQPHISFVHAKICSVRDPWKWSAASNSGPSCDVENSGAMDGQSCTGLMERGEGAHRKRDFYSGTSRQVSACFSDVFQKGV